MKKSKLSTMGIVLFFLILPHLTSATTSEWIDEDEGKIAWCRRNSNGCIENTKKFYPYYPSQKKAIEQRMPRARALLRNNPDEIPENIRDKVQSAEEFLNAIDRLAPKTCEYIEEYKELLERDSRLLSCKTAASKRDSETRPQVQDMRAN